MNANLVNILLAVLIVILILAAVTGPAFGWYGPTYGYGFGGVAFVLLIVLVVLIVLKV